MDFVKQFAPLAGAVVFSVLMAVAFVRQGDGPS